MSEEEVVQFSEEFKQWFVFNEIEWNSPHEKLYAYSIFENKSKEVLDFFRSLRIPSSLNLCLAVACVEGVDDVYMFEDFYNFLTGQITEDDIQNLCSAAVSYGNFKIVKWIYTKVENPEDPPPVEHVKAAIEWGYLQIVQWFFAKIKTLNTPEILKECMIHAVVNDKLEAVKFLHTWFLTVHSLLVTTEDTGGKHSAKINFSTLFDVLIKLAQENSKPKITNWLSREQKKIRVNSEFES